MKTSTERPSHPAMEKIGPGDRHHSKVSWPPELLEVEVVVPRWLAHLIRHNHPPSQNEAEKVGKFCSTFPQNMNDNERKQATIQKEIDNLMNRLHGLKHEHNRIQKQSFICKMALSPFRRLPDDVVYSIIIMAIDRSTYVTVDDGAELTHTPSTLARVSKQWRDTVCRVSRAWTDIRLWFNGLRCSGTSFSDRTDPGWNLKMQSRMTYFSRLSRSLPLTLNLKESNIAPLLQDYIYQFGLRTLLKWLFSDSGVLDRVTRLTISSPRIIALLGRLTEQVAILSMDDPINPPFSALSSCSFLPGDYSNEQQTEEIGRDLTTLLSKLPQLRKLWIGGSNMSVVDMAGPWSATSLSDWCMLTALYIASPLGIDEWQTILGACNNLRFGSFLLEEWDDEIPQGLPVDVRTHQYLQELRLEFTETSQHIFVFLGFKFPSLMTLQLRFSSSSLLNPGKLPAACSRISGIFPSLQRLILAGTVDIRTKIKYLFPLLLAAPTLEVLEATSLTYEHATSLLNFIRRDENGKPFLPSLKQVILTFTPDSTWTTAISQEKEFDAALLTTHRILSQHRQASGHSGSSDVTKAPYTIPGDTCNITMRFIWKESIHYKQGFGPRIQAYLNALEERVIGEGIDIHAVQEQVSALGLSEDDDRNEELLRYFDP